MATLEITNDNINDIYTCDHLSVTNIVVRSLKNIDLVLNELPKFVNLTKLNLNDN